MCLPNGRLNPRAVGWSRRALHQDNLQGWGRNKRFEYWCVMCEDFIVTANISHHDYRANVASTFMDLKTGQIVANRVNRWLPPRNSMSDPTDPKPMAAKADGIEVRITPENGGTRLCSKTERLALDAFVSEPPNHESMGVLVPWNDKTFQYTRKNNCLRTEGSVTVDGVRHIIDPNKCFALHDVGRGRWPYSTRWNWSAGHGWVGGRMIGLQFGGKWTAGTPSTENCLRIDGRVHKISEELTWDYDTADFMRPWTLRGARVDLTFTPTIHHHHMFNRWLISARGDQCFGHFDGQVVADDGEIISVKHLPGMAEEVHRKW
ncbi:MAG: DUF2804 domain-containing protein [Pseudorhodobacter sp.]|nr:DUF2804 domain-containing protein [Pseudorhodobacter sp.]